MPGESTATPSGMREVSNEGRGTFTPEMSLPWLLRDRAQANPKRTFAKRRDATGAFSSISIGQLLKDVNATAKGLIAWGIEPGQTVGILGGTRYEWTVLDFAIMSAGGVVVPIYHTSSREQVRWIAEDADVALIVAETDALAEVARPLIGETPLREVLVIDDGALEALRDAGDEVSDETLNDRVAHTGFDSLSSIVYTSGTTGRPKGVELSHGNLVSHIVNGPADPGLAPVVSGEGSSTLLFLPLSHVFGRFAQMLCVASGAVLGYAPDTKHLAEDLRDFQPSWLIAVPRVFETVHHKAEAAAGTGLTLKLFHWAEETAIAYSEALETASGPSPWLKAKRALADRLVLGRIRDAMGGRVRYAISGGAALSKRLGHFYRGLGVIVMEGYGATETVAPATVNRPDLIKIGTIGAPYAGCTIAVDDDGEILVKGPNVFKRYHHNEKATKEAFRDGWFVTGDLGAIDDDGYVRITGRKKEILVTAGGKNVQPAVLENSLRSNPLIGEAVVVGEGKPFVGALIALNEELLPGWLDQHGVGKLDLAAAREDETVQRAVQEAIDTANEQVSRAESIRKFVIVPRAFSETEGEVSASSKIIRRVVLEHFDDEMRELYGD